MPHYDLPLSELRAYRSAAPEPADLDEYWQRALALARTRTVDPVYAPYEADVYGAMAVDDVTFSGGDGHPVRGWFIRPAAADRPLACRVVFIGYGGGRGLPVEHALYAAAGHATFVMDSRSQGGGWGIGDTSDPGAGASGPEHPGVMA